MSADTLPRKIYELNRTLVVRTAETAGDAIRLVADSANRVAGASFVAGRTVVGQTRAAIDRTVTSTQRGVAEVSGQVEAQGAAVADTIDHEANRVVDRAIDVVDSTPPPGTPYESWTREQLYQRAQELDIEGRSSMSKQQLIRALRS
jgi:hypothetical protein